MHGATLAPAVVSPVAVEAAVGSAVAPAPALGAAGRRALVGLPLLRGAGFAGQAVHLLGGGLLGRTIGLQVGNIIYPQLMTNCADRVVCDLLFRFSRIKYMVD